MPGNRNPHGGFWAEHRASKGKLAPLPWPSLQLADSRPQQCKPIVHLPLGICFLPSYDSVRIISLKDASNLSSLSAPFDDASGAVGEFDSGDRRIVAILLNPHNPLQLIVAHRRPGVIRIWDYMKPNLLRTIFLPSPIQHVIGHTKLSGCLFVTVQKTASNMPEASAHTPDSILFRVSLEFPQERPKSRRSKGSTEVSQNSAALTRIAKTRPCLALCISPQDDYLLLLTRSKLHAYSLDELSKIDTKASSSQGGSVPANVRALALRNPTSSKMTCIATHPFRNIVATGDEHGHIRFWHNFDPAAYLAQDARERERNGKNQVSTGTAELSAGAARVTHWHSKPVGDLAFTPNGAYLLSGGQEAVLVLHHLSSGHLEFVPRLGFAIVSISSSPDIWTIGLADGTTIFIDPQTLTATHSVAGIKTNPPIHDRTFAKSVVKEDSLLEPLSSNANYHPPLQVDPLTGSLVLPSSYPSSIQFYSLPTATHLAEIQVASANSNRVTSIAGRKVSPVVVDHISFSPSPTIPTSNTTQSPPSPTYMATSDFWSTDDFAPECHLKFWSRNHSKDNFTLQSRIDSPHKGRITTLVFSPSATSPLALSTGSEDPYIKLWRDNDGTSRHALRAKGNNKRKDHRNEGLWGLSSTLSWRQRIPVSACFSTDGSLIAIAYSDIVTLWDTESLRLIHVLPVQKDIIGDVKSVIFVDIDPTSQFSQTGSQSNGSSFFNADQKMTSEYTFPLNLSACLVAGGSGGVTVWDVVTAQELFTFPMRTSYLFAKAAVSEGPTITGDGETSVNGDVDSASVNRGGSGNFVVTEFRGEDRKPSHFVYLFHINPSNPKVPEVEVGEIPHGLRQVGWYSMSNTLYTPNDAKSSNGDALSSVDKQVTLVVITHNGDVYLISPQMSTLANALKGVPSDLRYLSQKKDPVQNGMDLDGGEVDDFEEQGEIGEDGLITLYGMAKMMNTKLVLPTGASSAKSEPASVAGASSVGAGRTWLSSQPGQQHNLPSIFSAPAHLLPPTSAICNELMVKPLKEADETANRGTYTGSENILSLIPGNLIHEFKDAMEPENPEENAFARNTASEQSLQVPDDGELVKMFEDLFKNPEKHSNHTFKEPISDKKPRRRRSSVGIKKVSDYSDEREEEEEEEGMDKKKKRKRRN